MLSAYCAQDEGLSIASCSTLDGGEAGSGSGMLGDLALPFSESDLLHLDDLLDLSDLPVLSAQM
jgi:hypothetical protein